MNDMTINLSKLKSIIAEFVDERDWNQFHAPKNLSMDISIEASELMEKFLWIDSPASFEELKKNRQEIEDEFADVILACLAFANACDIDITKALLSKLERVKRKYPVALSRGRSHKYTAYADETDSCKCKIPNDKSLK